MPNQFFAFANSPWNSPARRELLAELAALGLPASKIAERINQDMPHNSGMLTRNAVLGACYRMRITMQSPVAVYVRASKANDVVKPKRKREPRRRMTTTTKEVKTKSWGFGSVNWTAPKAKPPMEDVREKPPLMIPLTELTSSTCRWPVGDPRDPGFGFCGHPPKTGSVYCGFHHKQSHVPGSVLKTPLKPPPEKGTQEAAA